jgi:hypothetical protein
MEPMPSIAAPFKTPRKKLVKVAPLDRSQALRHALQLGFLALNVWIGIQFYLFVRYYETGGRSVFAVRPAGVEGWLPIASLMNLKILLATGRVPGLHAAGMFLLIAFVGISWVFRKAFCGWLCPVGTISEYLWRFGRRICGHNFRLPRALDIGMRSLKYILLGLFLYAVGAMPVAAIRAFLEGPYGMVDDVKMLNFFRFLGLGGGTVMAILVIASVFVQNFWCRYLCPYGALMGAVSAASPLGIRRDANLCIDCGKCRATGRPPGFDPVGRMHRLPGMRRSVSRGGRAVPLHSATPQTRLGMGGSRRDRRVVSGHLRLRALDRPLELRSPQPRLFRADSARQRVPAPVANPTQKAEHRVRDGTAAAG